MLEFLTKNQTAIELILKIVTLIFTAGAAVWTISSGLKTFRNAGKNTKNKQISDWLQLFAETDDVRRLSAIHGLSENCSEIYCELFLLCGREHDWFLKSRIETELLKKVGKNIDAIIEYNKICFKYYMTDEVSSTDGSLSKLPLKGYENVLKRKITEYRISDEILHKLRRENADYTVSGAYLDEYICLSGQIMAKYINEKHKLKLECGILCGASLYGSKLKKSNISTSLIADCVMRHAKIKNVDLKGSAFILNNMIDSKIKRFKCTDSEFKDIKLLSSLIKKLKFEKSNVENCRFNTAILKKPVFSKTYFKETQFSGAKIKKLHTDGCTYVESLFRGTVCLKSDISNVKFFRCKMNGGAFKKCSFEDIKTGGSEFNGAVFRECTFTNADFAGSLLRNTRFICCSFKNVNFVKARELNIDNLKDCKGLDKCTGLERS